MLKAEDTLRHVSESDDILCVSIVISLSLFWSTGESEIYSIH